MEREIPVRVILDTVRKAGDMFLTDYKKNAIAENRQQLLMQLAVIDERCLAVLQSGLAEAFPETPWHVGDEFDNEAQKQPLDFPEYWLCDAMDGAIQYLQHIAGWTINLVLVRKGRPYFSVVYDPLAGEIFWAEEGEGAFMNDTAIRPAAKTDADVMLAVFEYGHQEPAIPGLNRRHGAAVTALLDTFGIVRNYGPHGLQLAYVGAGRVEAFYQLGLDTFNWLAGVLIAREAGAEVLNAHGQPWAWGDDSILVTAPGVATRFLKTTQMNAAL